MRRPDEWPLASVGWMRTTAPWRCQRRHVAEVERVLAQELDLLVGPEPVEDARHRGGVGARLRQDVRAVAIDRQTFASSCRQRKYSCAVSCDGNS